MRFVRSWWRQFTRGTRALADERTVDQEVADEVGHFIEQTERANLAKGMPLHDARRMAMLEVGNTTQVREQIKSYGWENRVNTFLTDLRYALRRLRNKPGFTALTVLTLALGVGATTAIFSAVKPILFQSLPYPHAERILTIAQVAGDGSPFDNTFGTYRELVDRSRTLEHIAVMREWQPTLSGAGQPERFVGQRVSASYFSVLGVAPAIGRNFNDADDKPNVQRVAILSDGLWRRRFGADRAVVGSAITLDGLQYAIIGVMPAGFENVMQPDAEIWRALQYDMSLPMAWGHHLRTIARVRPSSSLEGASRELQSLSPVLIASNPSHYWREGFIVNTLQSDITRGVKPALLAVMGAVLLVLVIACVNVTNLLLAAGAQRRGEFAVRAALGAGRGRMIRQLLTENVLLSAFGGLGGLMVARVGVQALIALAPNELPRSHAIRVDGMVLMFGVVITALIGVVVGLLPALRSSRETVGSGLQFNSRRATGGHHRASGLLVIAEVSLAVVLLVGSGLLLRSLQRLFSVAPGFTASGLLTMQVQTSGPKYSDAAPTNQFFSQTLDAVRQLPGVTSAAYTSQLPLSTDFDSYGVHFESSPTDRPNEDRSAFRYSVTPGYFETMQIALKSGRFLNDQDKANAPLSAVLNESFARRKFPGMNPIGQRLRIGPSDSDPYTVVGVVADVKQTSLALRQLDAVYITTTQWHFADNALTLVVRSNSEPASLTAQVRNAIWGIDKDQPIVRVATMQALVEASAAQRRFALILFEAFAATALVLAAAGIYGIISGRVSERMREIGIRSAMGASRSSILTLVLRQGMALAFVGMSVGLIAAMVASRVLDTLLFGVTRLDPATYVGVSLLLIAISATACSFPAWRASRVDPAITLRAE